MSTKNITTLRVHLGERSYDLIVTTGDLVGVGAFGRQRNRGSRAFIVTDQHLTSHAHAVVAALQGSGFQTFLAILPSGEAQKSLKVANELYEQMLDFQADRRTLVVAVGGGVIGDLAGFVAATFARGVPLLMVPTTLLAMVDSSVGGKVAVNLPRAKNMVGVFHQPIGVWVDTATLATLPTREYASGLAEVVKYGVILDPELFAYLETQRDAILRREPEVVRHIVARCCQLKASVVEQDEREEKGVRVILNYGHTFAHAFETAASYGGWLHGEAVAAGMICASRLAERRGLIGGELTQRQRELLVHFGLPTKPETWPPGELLATMRTDKKSLGGRLRLVLPRRLGEVGLFDDVGEEEVERILLEVAS